MMDQTRKLETVEKLIGYTGLGHGKAKDYLEKTQWNVDAAYHLYKTNQLAQSGFQQPTNQTRNSEPPSHTRPLYQPGVTYSRQVSNFQQPDVFGSVMSGMGPAVGASIHPAFRPPQPMPKFPVQRERIIPIQVEKQQPVMKGGRSTPPPQSIPPWHSQPHSPPNNLPKSQTYPVSGTGDNQRPPQQVRGDNTVLGKVAIAPTESSALKTDGHINPPRQHSERNETEVKLSPPESKFAVLGSASPKILKRGISKISENAMLVDEERKNVLHDIIEDCHDNMYVQTFILPDIAGYAEDFREFLERDLIELSTLVSLEQAGRLNWWAELGICQRLLPMATSGDGNCLLHAASLAMWGIHDRQLLLRRALYETLTKKYYRQSLYRRWRWQQTQANKQAGLIFSEEEWKNEWDNVLRLSSTTPRSVHGIIHRNSCCDSAQAQAHVRSCNKDSNKEVDCESPVVYESLEEFHVFVLAHVIQRPIIVVADTILRDANGDAMAPIPFGGIYLPVECDASHCYRSPLLLTYDAAHFSALVPMHSTKDEDRNDLPVAIPIVSSELTTLPLHFVIDPGIHYNWEKTNGEFAMSEDCKINLLKRYMDLEKLDISSAFLDGNNDDRNSTGSYESDDGLIEKGKKKDKRVSQQLQSVTKQFGSFGKSVGKKLKNLGKGNKDEKKKSSLIQTRVPLTISALGEFDHQSIWCCRIANNKTETHQKMIDNYLYDAGVRYKVDVASPRLLRRRDNVGVDTKNGKKRQQRVPCVTNGCSLYGTADTSYLCSNCYADQKKHIFDQEKEYETKHKCNADKEKDATKIGKSSKFYDMNNTPKMEKDRHIQPKLVVDLNSQTKGQKMAPKPPRSRSPSPDYDNVDYDSAPKYSNGPIKVTVPPKSPIPAGKIFTNTGSIGSKCLNPDCNFYGSSETENYCSGCYKTKPKHDLRHV